MNSKPKDYQQIIISIFKNEKFKDKKVNRNLFIIHGLYVE